MNKNILFLALLSLSVSKGVCSLESTMEERNSNYLAQLKSEAFGLGMFDDLDSPVLGSLIAAKKVELAREEEQRKLRDEAFGLGMFDDLDSPVLGSLIAAKKVELAREEEQRKLKAKAISLGLMDRLDSVTLEHEVFTKEQELQNI